MPFRRLRRLLAVSVLLVVGLVLLDGFWLEPASIRVVPQDVAAPGPLKGLRIAVISDLHAGAPYIDADKIDRIVAMTNAARPDLVLLAGDYRAGRMLGGRHVSAAEVAGRLKGLKARLGVYAVLGNHDSRSVVQTVTAFKAAGIEMLRDRHVTLAGGIPLAGLDDYFTLGPDPVHALAGVSGGAICLTHSPDIFPELPAACALTIAGHTHGGQVWLPVLGRPAVGWLASRHGQRYAAGVIRENGKTLFVSSGIGTSGLPVRLGVPPEISLLYLH